MAHPENNSNKVTKDSKYLFNYVTPLNSRTHGAAAECLSEVFLNEIGAKGQQQKPSKIVPQSRKGDQAGFDPSPRIRMLVPLAFMTAILFTPPLFRVKAR